MENETNIPFSSVKYPLDKYEKEEKTSNLEEQIVQKTGQIFEIPELGLESKKNNRVERSSDILRENEPILEETNDVDFIDVEREINMIHIYGPPSSGKTTFAIQAAIEIFPKNSYFLITSHSTSFLKRLKLMIADKRWKEFGELNKHIYPISMSNLAELEEHIENFKLIDPNEIGLIVIDHITDYIRGEIHKEERRIRLRNILETLYLLSDEKQCKVILVNGFSYKDSAPAEDIIESFCDMTVLAESDGKDTNLLVKGEKIKTDFDNSGIRNVHLNIYF